MKHAYRLLSVLLALTFCLTAAVALISCGDTPSPSPAPEPDDGGNTDDNKTTYTVTVTDTDGAAVSGVSLLFSNGTDLFKNATTDANGRATVEQDANKPFLGVSIISVPNTHVKPEATNGMYHSLFGNTTFLSLQLEKNVTETVSYTVKIVDQNGDAVQGVEIQICHTVCVQCDLTNANGETVKELPATVTSGTLKVGILNAPDGYTIPEATIDGSYHAIIEAGETSITITITKN